MKSRNFILVVVVSLVLMFTTTNRIQGKQLDLSPFIYYFSEADGGFVIESADGKDKTVLIDYSLPSLERPILVEGPGWSPSGIWFAWTIINSDYGAVSPVGQAFIYNRLTHQTISLVDTLQEQITIKLNWSPTSDLLLVEKTNFSQVQQMSIVESKASTIVIFDPINQIPRVEIEGFADRARWVIDGNYVLLKDFYDADREEVFEMVLLSPDGQQESIPIIADRLCYDRTYIASEQKQWLIYPAENNRLMLLDTLENTIQEIDNQFSSVIQYIVWHPQGDYALVFTGNECDSEPFQIWLVSITKVTLELIEDSGDLIPVYTSPSSYWSDSGEFALVLDTNGKIGVLSTKTEDITYFANADLFYTWEWQADEKLFIASADTVFEYDLTTSTLKSQKLPVLNNIFRLSLSGNQEMIGIIGFPTLILNNEFKIIAEIDLLLDKNFSGGELPIEDILWHPQSNYAFIYAREGNRIFLNILNSENMFQRELTDRVSLSPAGFGWLPEVTQ